MQTREISEQSWPRAQMFLFIFAAVFLFPCVLEAAAGPANAPALAKAPGDAHFVPRYDLVIRKQHLDLPRIQNLFDTLSRSNFRRELEGLGGYDTRVAGQRVL